MRSERWKDWELVYLRCEVHAYQRGLFNCLRPSIASRIRWLHKTVLKVRSKNAIQQRFYRELQRFD